MNSSRSIAADGRGETARVKHSGLSVAADLNDLVEREILPGTGLDQEQFWSGFADLISAFTPENLALLERRDRIQKRIDEWHRANPGPIDDERAYRAFLRSLEYLVAVPDDFAVETKSVDPEVATVAGPQLVVPVKNARFALNAANARWGSLYDALYGTDVIDESDGADRSGVYNPIRGQRVVAFAKDFLDRHFPLSAGSHADAAAYRVVDGQLVATMADDSSCHLANDEAFAGHQGSADEPSAILLRHHGLHVHISVDRQHPVGATDPAGISDIELESAVSTIQDCEDSVAAVDAEDKTEVYRNWLGLMRRDLTCTFDKGGRTVTRTLNPSRVYVAPDGGQVSLPGCSLLLVRNVGIHMRTDAILDSSGEEVFEGLLDAVITSACAMQDLRRGGADSNSRAGSIYIVKPKLHGPEEVSFAVQVFAAVEALLGLPERTIKIGIMDEERRTTVNLAACIHAAKDRVIFINTGFLDRTGDEIHTAMEAGPMVRKESMKAEAWIQAYEDWNVDVGLACGLRGVGQIGKGMWPKPDQLGEMLATKRSHPQAGATCAWVPSPTAATLHAIHYHEVDVAARQRELEGQRRARLADLLRLPLVPAPTDLAADDVQAELENNCQGLLGYVVRWVDQGVGCSKVPDIHGEGLMEDRATLRISSQHVANWLRHGVCKVDEVEATLRRMARVVDDQNQGDPAYRRMSDDFDGSLAFQAARALIFEGCEQPNGYTEFLLHRYRRRVKAASPRP